jgi:hypothetical protein
MTGLEVISLWNWWLSLSTTNKELSIEIVNYAEGQNRIATLLLAGMNSNCLLTKGIHTHTCMTRQLSYKREIPPVLAPVGL